jgi:hypothetical protein
MSKSLRRVQTTIKVFSVLTTIAQVFTVIGLVACAVACPLFILMGSVEVDGATFADHILLTSGANYPTVIFAMLSAIVILIGAIITLHYTKKYFNIELRDGTPFTDRGATAMKHLGFAYLIVNIVVGIIVAGMNVVFVALFTDVQITSTEVSVDIAAAIFCFILAAIFRHGAELNNKVKALENPVDQTVTTGIQFPPIRPGK